MAEQRNILIGYMAVANATITAVTDMVLGQQVLFVEIPLGAVGGSTLARSPKFGKQKTIVGIDDRNDGFLQPVLRNMA